MYADDIYFFSVAGLRKLTESCANYGKLFNITYNANKSYCMVIDSKPQDIKNIHCVNLNNHPLPYTSKCKYLGHIINNSLTDDDNIARQKDAFMHRLMFYVEKLFFVVLPPKLLYFKYTVVQCTLLVWCKLITHLLKKSKGKFLYSAVSSP